MATGSSPVIRWQRQRQDAEQAIRHGDFTAIDRYNALSERIAAARASAPSLRLLKGGRA